MGDKSDKIPFTWTAIACDDANLVFNPVLPYITCGGYTDARVMFEVAGSTDGAFQAKAVLQFADYPDESSKPQTNVSATETANGIKYPGQWYTISANADANQIMRLAFEANRSSGTGYCSARISGVLELKKA